MKQSGQSRAVILGGGGVTGISWEIGVIAGLTKMGVDLTAVDAVIGTSAGAFAAVEILSGADIAERYRAQFAADHKEIAVAMSPETMRAFGDAVQAGYPDPREMAKNLGAMAMRSDTVSTAARTEVVAHRLPVSEWPTGPLKATAIDAETGELHLLDKSSGLTLAEAVAASGAVPGLWPVVDAGGHRWIDGGSVSGANAELAARYDRVLLIAPVVVGFPGMPTVEDILTGLSDKVQTLLISPDDLTRAAIGENVFDPTRRGPAAEGGHAQGVRAADAVRQLFSPS